MVLPKVLAVSIFASPVCHHLVPFVQALVHLNPELLPISRCVGTVKNEARELYKKASLHHGARST